MLTGARPGELASATVGQFDARTKTIRFDGKTGARTVLLSQAAIVLFRRLSKNKLPGAFLFTRDDGKVWAHRKWAYPVREAVTKARLPRETVLYSCRHSWISEAIRGGMTTLEVARITVTSIQMIEEHYGHLADEAARERLNKVTML